MKQNTDIATRALVVSLKAPCHGKTTAQVVALTGLSKSTINDIYARAIARGFDPNQRPLIIRNSYVEDAPRSGRPTKCTEEAKEAVISKVHNDQHKRDKSCADIANELSSEGIQLSATSVGRVLKAAKLRKKKSRPKSKQSLPVSENSSV